jgi:hypothetical protein
MPDSRYFELAPHIGLAPNFLTGKDGQPVENPAAGSPEPLVEERLTIGVPTMVGKDVIQVPQSVTLKAIPGTRILKVDDPLAASALAGHPNYHRDRRAHQEVLAGARSTTEDARSAGQEA